MYLTLSNINCPLVWGVMIPAPYSNLISRTFMAAVRTCVFAFTTLQLPSSFPLSPTPVLSSPSPQAKITKKFTDILSLAGEAAPPSNQPLRNRSHTHHGDRHKGKCSPTQGCVQGQGIGLSLGVPGLQRGLNGANILYLFWSTVTRG